MVGPLPLEGFGFSNNPALSFGAPSFRRARFSIGQGASRQIIRVHYLL
jgi:uncharacterized protein (DUF2141 family)